MPTLSIALANGNEACRDLTGPNKLSIGDTGYLNGHCLIYSPTCNGAAGEDIKVD
jgi:hypothetical protein